ncbi:MAG: IS200/IS605 family transposase [Bryobacteraceae bacterium]
MAHTFACLLVHVIFSTKDRAPDLSPDLANRLFPYMGGMVRKCKGTALIINGPPDHVHLLLSIPATASVADMLRVLKANSSCWMREQFPGRKGFGRQAGYGAFTVSGSPSDDVRRYIASQEAHHRKVSFQEEFLTLLRKHGLEYDVREVWG